MPDKQSYASHRRYFPAHHFFVTPVLLINVIVQVTRFLDTPSFDTGWPVIFGTALLVFAFTSRIMALTAQNRVIRLEERLRLMRLMPAGEHGRIDELATRQLVGLRFASDEEVVGLARRCLAGELPSAGDVKRSVKTWRPDYLRV